MAKKIVRIGDSEYRMIEIGFDTKKNEPIAPC